MMSENQDSNGESSASEVSSTNNATTVSAHPGFFGGSTVRDGMVRRLKASSFKDFLDRYIMVPAQIDLTRKEFLAHPEKNDIKDGLWISPCAYDYEVEGKRGNAHATQIVLLCFDFDGGKFAGDFDRNRETLRMHLHPFNYVCWRTASYTGKDPHLRLIVEVVPFSPEHLRRYIQFLTKSLGAPPDFKGVVETSTISQPAYRPVKFKNEEFTAVLASRTDGRALQESDLPDPAEELAEVMGEKTYGSKHTDLTDLGLAYMPLASVTLEDFKDALSAIDPDCDYRTWLTVCAAARHQFPDEADAREAHDAFDEWSSGGTKYRGRGETWAKWKSFKPYAEGRAPVTIRSLFKLAWDAGWTGGPDQDADVPPFPLHCLPPVAQDLAREVVRVTMAENEPLAAATIIGTLSASIGAGLEIPSGPGDTRRGNLYIFVIAESGTGKGQNFKFVVAPLLEYEEESIGTWALMEQPGIAAELDMMKKKAKKHCSDGVKAKTAKDRNEHLEKQKEAEIRVAELSRELKSAPCYCVDNVTSEKLAIVMQAQPGEFVASMSSEARDLFSILKGRYSGEGGDESIYLKSYSGDFAKFDRVGRQGVILNRPCLTLVWMVQPDVARKALCDEVLMESGWMARCLMFDAKAEAKEKPAEISPISDKIATSWRELIRDLLRTYRDNGENPEVLKISGDAANALHEFNQETIRLRSRKRKGDLASFVPFVSRWAENAYAMTLVLHAGLWGKDAKDREVALDTAEKAIEIVRWFADRQIELLRTGQRDKERERLSVLLAALGKAKGEISLRDLDRDHGISKGEVRSLHSLFPKSFSIVKRETGGRPSWVVTTRAEEPAVAVSVDGFLI